MSDAGRKADSHPFVSEEGHLKINVQHFVVPPETELQRFSRLYREAKRAGMID